MTDPAAPDPAVPTRAGGSIARAGLIVTTAFLASRVLGYVRVVVIGSTFGAGTELDAFFAAFRIPDLLFQLVAAGALSSALVPVLSGLLATGETAKAWRVASTVSTLVLVVLAGLSIVGLAFVDALVAPITPGFDAETRAMTVDLTRIMLAAPVLLAAGALATSILNAEGRFAASAVAPIAYNLAIIGAAVLLAPTMGVTGLAVGVAAGAAGHVLVQLPGLRALGAALRPRFGWDEPAARRVLGLMAPRALGLGAVQIVFLVMTSLASGLSAGSITAFTFAFTVLQIPIGVIGVPLGIVLLPSLSREAAIGDIAEYRRLLVRALRLLAYVMVSVTVLGIVTAHDVVRLLFDYGAIDPTAIGWTATTLQVFLVGLTAHASIALLARAFYALQDTRTPVAAALIAVGVNVVIALALVEPLGLAGLATAIAVGAWVEVLLLVGRLDRRVEGIWRGEIGRILAVTLVVAVVAGAIALAVGYGLTLAWGDAPGQPLVLARFVATTAAGGLALVAGSTVARVPELRLIGDVGRAAVGRRLRR